MVYEQRNAGSILDDYKDGNSLSRLETHIVRFVRAYELDSEADNLSRHELNDLCKSRSKGWVFNKIVSLKRRGYLEEKEDELFTTEKARHKL